LPEEACQEVAYISGPPSILYRDGRNSFRGIKNGCENTRKVDGFKSIDRQIWLLASSRCKNACVTSQSKRCCVPSECCAAICMRDRQISEACTGRSLYLYSVARRVTYVGCGRSQHRTSFVATASVVSVSHRLTFRTDRSTRNRLTGQVRLQPIA